MLTYEARINQLIVVVILMWSQINFKHKREDVQINFVFVCSTSPRNKQPPVSLNIPTRCPSLVLLTERANRFFSCYLKLTIKFHKQLLLYHNNPGTASRYINALPYQQNGSQNVPQPRLSEVHIHIQTEIAMFNANPLKIRVSTFNIT